MAKARDGSKEPAAELPPPAFVRVRITHYKIETSQGRYIEDQCPELPPQEADDLVAMGYAKPC